MARKIYPYSLDRKDAKVAGVASTIGAMTGIDPTFIRIGSSGALQPEIALGDLVISTGAVRLENTTDFYVHPGYPAIAHRQVVWALEAACRWLGFSHHVGHTATASGFYAPQGRAMRTLPVRYPELAEELRRQRVANLEMESSALFVLAGLAGLRSGTICAAYAQRTDGTFLEGAAKEAAEARCIDAGLAGIHLLWEIDSGTRADPLVLWSAETGGKNLWYSSEWRKRRTFAVSTRPFLVETRDTNQSHLRLHRTITRSR